VGQAVDGPELLKGVDPGKDQSYFLYTLNRRILERVLFPVGELPKSEVRRLAAQAGLATAAKKDSTGICFIGERDFPEFLGRYVRSRPGRILSLDGTELGEHRGACFYTLGQRKGLGLGGEGEPYFVVAKDAARNIVYVERGSAHPALYADSLTAVELSWVSGSPPPELPLRCRAKTRYRQQDQACRITRIEGDRLHAEFEIPQRSMTPGQSVVFYLGERCLGGGVIERPGPSYHERGFRAVPGISSDPEARPSSA
jgi:tRNA-specific 2-thiouridylase